MDITLYSTGCPKCRVLKQKLKSKGLEFTENNSMEEMEKMGFTSAPMLKVSDCIMDFGNSIKWLATL